MQLLSSGSLVVGVNKSGRGTERRTRRPGASRRTCPERGGSSCCYSVLSRVIITEAATRRAWPPVVSITIRIIVIIAVILRGWHAATVHSVSREVGLLIENFSYFTARTCEDHIIIIWHVYFSGVGGFRCKSVCSMLLAHGF